MEANVTITYRGYGKDIGNRVLSIGNMQHVISDGGLM